MRSRNANALQHIHGPAVGGNFLNVHQRWSGRECHGPWINDRQSTVHGKPDPSDGIGNDRLVPLYALCTVEAVCETIFTPIRFTDCVARKRVTIYAQNMVRSCYPQRARFVFLDSEDLFMQRFWHVAKSVNGSRAHKAQTAAAANPTLSRRVALNRI